MRFFCQCSGSCSSTACMSSFGLDGCILEDPYLSCYCWWQMFKTGQSVVRGDTCRAQAGVGPLLQWVTTMPRWLTPVSECSRRGITTRGSPQMLRGITKRSSAFTTSGRSSRPGTNHVQPPENHTRSSIMTPVTSYRKQGWNRSTTSCPCALKRSPIDRSGAT